MKRKMQLVLCAGFLAMSITACGTKQTEETVPADETENRRQRKILFTPQSLLPQKNLIREKWILNCQKQKRKQSVRHIQS